MILSQKLTNLSSFLYHKNDIPLGCGTKNFHEILIENKEVKILLRVRNNRNPLNDNLCMVSFLGGLSM